MPLLLFSIGVLIFFAYICYRLFERTGIPDVLPLFAVGLVLGPITGTISPEMLGGAGELIASLTLISVLFVGGLNIHIRTLVTSFPKTSLLMLLNLVGTVVLVTTLAYLLFDVAIIAGVIVGILLGGTSSAIVIPIARRLNVTDETRTVLAVESDLNDVFSVTLAVALVAVMQEQTVSLSALPLDIAVALGASLAIGAITALLWSRLLSFLRGLDHHIFTTPALLLITYGVAEGVGAIGAIAILVFGITLGNLASIKQMQSAAFSRLTQFRLTETEHSFFQSLVFLFKTFFFVYLGIVMPLNEPVFMLWGAGLMLVLYALRIVLVDLVLGSDVSSFDRTVAKSMLPKGLTGGALLVLIGDPLLSQLTYPVILMSICFTAGAVFLMQLRKRPAVPEQPQPGT